MKYAWPKQIVSVHALMCKLVGHELAMTARNAQSLIEMQQVAVRSKQNGGVQVKASATSRRLAMSGKHIQKSSGQIHQGSRSHFLNTRLKVAMGKLALQCLELVSNVLQRAGLAAGFPEMKPRATSKIKVSWCHQSM